MILVTGATGLVGSSVLACLCRPGRAAGAEPCGGVRGLARTPERADDLRGLGCEVAVADYADGRALRRAMEDVDALFLVSRAGPDQVELETAVIEAACGVARPHVVKLSAAGAAEDSPVRSARAHAQVVSRLAASGLPYTVLAPTAFLENLLPFAASVTREGVLRLPAGGGAVAHVDARDVGACGAAVLADPASHAGRTYTLTGGAALTFAQVAETLSDHLGREVRYSDVAPDDARDWLRERGTAWDADNLLEVFGMMREGGLAEVTDGVERLTERRPHSLVDFLRGHPAAFPPR